jgi:hypothetical protein
MNFFELFEKYPVCCEISNLCGVVCLLKAYFVRKAGKGFSIKQPPINGIFDRIMEIGAKN